MEEGARLWARWTIALLANDGASRGPILQELRADRVPVQQQGLFVPNLGIFMRSAYLAPGGVADAEAVARMMIERAPAIGEEALGDLDEIRGRLGAARMAMASRTKPISRSNGAHPRASAGKLTSPSAATALETHRGPRISESPFRFP